MKCEDCKFWEELKRIEQPEDGRLGLCHRYPPKYNLGEEFDGEHVHNQSVCFDNWCGEFQPQKINNLLKGDTE